MRNTLPRRPAAAPRKMKSRAAELLGAASILAILGAGTVSAAEPAAPAGRSERSAVRDFDIPAQPLAGALTAFGLQSGLQITVDSAILGGIGSPGVKGSRTPEQALDALLAGTGIFWRFGGPATVLLERVAASASPQGPVVMALDPVTVSGERMERSLMDTASSVSVVDAKTIERTPDLAGTNAVTEGMANVVTIEPGNNAPIIRGLNGTGAANGAVAFFAGVRPRLTMQVDGRPLSFHDMVFGDSSLWDVDQVEMFRGPQSTVQGRNSIAGAMVIKTKDPTFKPEGKVRAIGGNFDTGRFSGMISGPIIDDQVAARLSVDRSTSSSKLAFTPYLQEQDPKEYEATTLRAKLLIEPKKLDGFRTLLTVNRNDYKGPGAEYLRRSFTSGTPQSAQVATFNPHSTSGILDTTWVLNDKLTLENKFSMTGIDVIRHITSGNGNVNVEGLEGVLEPRLKFSLLDGRLNGFGGYYGMRGSQDDFIDMNGGNSYKDETETDAVFGEATLGVTDKADITAGMRLEQEHRRRVGGAGRYAVDFDETYSVFLPKLGAAWHFDSATTVGATVSRGYNGGGAGVTFSTPFVSYTYKPEYVWNYETYARTEMLDGTLRLTGNLFMADYKNMQLPVTLAASSVVVRNIDEARTYGAELGARWLATPDLELSGELGLLKTEVLRYAAVTGYEGNELPHAPALTASAGVTYRPFEGAEVGGDLRYSEAYFSEIGNDVRGLTKPYWVANMRASYDFGGPKVFGYVRNLFDVWTPVDIGVGTTAANDYITMLRTRTFGMGVEMTF